MTTHLTRAILLSGSDIKAALGAVRTVKAMSADDGQMYLKATWFQWRHDSDNMDGVKDGFGLFFDFYFMTQGNFDKMEKELLELIPEKFHAEAIAEADGLARNNVRIVEEAGPHACTVKHSFVDMTDAERNNGIMIQPSPDALPS